MRREGKTPAILALDTAGDACSALLAAGSRLLAEESMPMRHGHDRALMPLIDRLIGNAGIPRTAIDTVAVCVGPGGFTGMRIGLAAARGIALGLGARLIGITGFEAILHEAMLQEATLQGAASDEAAAPRDGSWLLAAIDSRRADLYLQLYDPQGRPAGVAAAILPADAASFVASVLPGVPLRLAGDAAVLGAVEAALAGRPGPVRRLQGPAPRARGVWRAVLAPQDHPEGDAVRPLYLRPPEISMPRPSQPAPGLPPGSSAPGAATA